MKNDRPVFIVKSKDNQSLDEIYGCFDSKQKAMQYSKRFKTALSNFEIVEISVNPSYYTDRTVDPYYIVIDKTATLPGEVHICNSIPLVQEVKKEAYNIAFSHGKSEHDGTFIFQCFATDENDAIDKAIIKRDTLIYSGAWNHAWSNYLNRHDKSGL